MLTIHFSEIGHHVLFCQKRNGELIFGQQSLELVFCHSRQSSSLAERQFFLQVELDGEHPFHLIAQFQFLPVQALSCSDVTGNRRAGTFAGTSVPGYPPRRGIPFSPRFCRGRDFVRVSGPSSDIAR
jgi:hypothetical protein